MVLAAPTLLAVVLVFTISRKILALAPIAMLESLHIRDSCVHDSCTDAIHAVQETHAAFVGTVTCVATRRTLRVLFGRCSNKLPLVVACGQQATGRAQALDQ